MTQPGSLPSMVPAHGLDDVIARRFRDFDRRLATVEAQAMASNGIVLDGSRAEVGILIKAGGMLRVEDADGNRAVELGITGEDSYGLSVTDPVSGDTMQLARLAFGMAAASNSPVFDCPGNGIWRADSTDEPLEVVVSTGRLLVIVSACQYSSVSGSNVLMSWDLDGPTAIGPDQYRALVTACASFPAAGYGSSSFAFLHTGLAPGEYTLTPRYRCDQYGATADTGYFRERSLIAWPL